MSNRGGVVVEVAGEPNVVLVRGLLRRLLVGGTLLLLEGDDLELLGGHGEDAVAPADVGGEGDVVDRF